MPSGRLVRRLFSFHFTVAGWLREFNKNPKKEPDMANRNTNPGIGETTDSGVCGYIVLRACNGEVGRVGRVRRVGQWFLEIDFESFAQDLATPSARSFAHESESQNTMQLARSFAQDLASREGQRPRCPHGDESRAAGTLPIPCEGESQKPSLSRKSLPNISTNESYGVSQSMLKRRMQVCDDFLSRRNIKISQEVV